MLGCASETRSVNARGGCCQSRDGQKLGWDMDSERMGSPGGRVCEALRGLRSVLCSQIARRRSQPGRAHVFAWGTPRNAGFALNAQSDVMAARVVGIRQEGLNPCRMVPSEEGQGARTAAMTSRQRCAAVNCHAGVQVASCRAGDAQFEEEKKVEQSKPRFG